MLTVTTIYMGQEQVGRWKVEIGVVDLVRDSEVIHLGLFIFFMALQFFLG